VEAWNWKPWTGASRTTEPRERNRTEVQFSVATDNPIAPANTKHAANPASRTRRDRARTKDRRSSRSTSGWAGVVVGSGAKTKK
jgi:hypothetical protein